jgi:hypothetical protein
MLCFFAAPSCGGRPQLCQPDPYLTLLRVVCQLSFVLAVQREPVEQTNVQAAGEYYRRVLQTVEAASISSIRVNFSLGLPFGLPREISAASSIDQF